MKSSLNTNNLSFRRIEKTSLSFIDNKTQPNLDSETQLNQLSFIEVGYGQPRELSDDINEMLTDIQVVSPNKSQHIHSSHNFISPQNVPLIACSVNSSPHDFFKKIYQSWSKSCIVVFNIHNIGDCQKLFNIIINFLNDFEKHYKNIVCITNGIQTPYLHCHANNIYQYLEGLCLFNDLIHNCHNSSFPFIHCPLIPNDMDYRLRQCTFTEFINHCKEVFSMTLIINNLSSRNYFSTFCQCKADGIVMVTHENEDSFVSDWKSLNEVNSTKYLGWVCIPISFT
jgi:hypothetical protein